MIEPRELASEHPYGPWSCRGCDVWDVLCAAARGDVTTLRNLLANDPNLYRAEYATTQPIHLAVREGHVEAVRLLLDAGSEASSVGPDGDRLVTLAADRSHTAVARLLDRALGLPAPSTTTVDHAIHAAAASDEVARLGVLLDAQPTLLERRDRKGRTPLLRAVAGSARGAIRHLLDRGADIHAYHLDGPGTAEGYAAPGFQPIDLALWTGPFWNIRGDLETARLLLDHGATRDLAIAAALGDEATVATLLDASPERIHETRPCGKRALSSASQFGHPSIVRSLLDRGADPNAAEGASAPRGVALHAAAGAGDRALVELLLEHGADPNGTIDASGSATYAASTRELRGLLIAHGGTLDPYDLVWLGEDDEAVRQVAKDPSTAHSGCGGVLAAACTLGKRELLHRLLAAGARVAPVVTGCRSYLLAEPDMLRDLLTSGMDPDLPDWQRATPLHDLCGRDGRGRPRPHREESATLLFDAGADIVARDEGYRSTPLAWAARNDLPDMVALLLDRGAPTELADDEPWATPLAWAKRRGHGRITSLLQAAGAVA